MAVSSVRARPASLSSMSASVYSPPDIAPEPDEEEWFGEGSAFENSEELASALLSIAPTTPIDTTSGASSWVSKVPVVVPGQFPPEIGAFDGPGPDLPTRPLSEVGYFPPVARPQQPIVPPVPSPWAAPPAAPITAPWEVAPPATVPDPTFVIAEQEVLRRGPEYTTFVPQPVAQEPSQPVASRSDPPRKWSVRQGVTAIRRAEAAISDLQLQAARVAWAAAAIAFEEDDRPRPRTARPVF